MVPCQTFPRQTNTWHLCPMTIMLDPWKKMREENVTFVEF